MVKKNKSKDHDKANWMKFGEWPLRYRVVQRKQIWEWVG